MKDLISRQAAIEAISCDITVTGRQNAELVAATIGTFADRIKALPSVQPEQSSEIQDILEYLDTVLHPIISPDHWNVYSELHDMISMLPSAQPIDVQEAYYRGKIDGIKECTTRLKKMNEEFANGRHDLQTSGDRCAEPTS